ncbi:MAG: hybrid sensor histidine kinase/response regulator [Desulfobacteraceae bacterium]|nr:MAG: hybrid sensor histidine kinase/response regulator [Desulfobacteraceae bacterium]
MIDKIPPPNILIVDDEPANIEMLGEVLMPENKIRVVVNGPEAIEIALSSNPPDLILLDIMMPGMDGYEVCRRLKADKRTSKIPVIFITAKSEENDEKKGFQIGAVDYITKPFRLSVIQARVRTHLALKRYQDHMETIVREQTEDIRTASEYLRLEVEERKKTQVTLEQTNQSLKDSLLRLQETQDHLIRSEKMAALGGLVAGVAHEINTPVGIGVTASSFLAMETRKMAERMAKKEIQMDDMQKYISIASEATAIIENNLKRAGDLIQSFKQVGVDQSSKDRRFFRCREYLDMVLLSLRPKLKKGRHQVIVDCPEFLEIDSYPGVFSQIITNFVINSLIHGFHGESQKIIHISLSQEGERLRFTYKDNGKGMSRECVEKVFEPFFTTKRNSGGTGLGLHIVYNLVTQVLQGTIQCTSRPDEGAEFTITAPLNPQPV